MERTSRHTDLGVELESFVVGALRDGLFRSREELIRSAVHLLKDENERFEEGIRRGLADVAAGRVYEVDEVFDSVEALIRRKYPRAAE